MTTQAAGMNAPRFDWQWLAAAFGTNYCAFVSRQPGSCYSYSLIVRRASDYAPWDWSVRGHDPDDGTATDGGVPVDGGGGFEWDLELAKENAERICLDCLSWERNARALDAPPDDFPDFMTLPNPCDPGASGYTLFRHDLAVLRQCARAPGGVEDGNVICKASRDRLAALGLVERRATPDGARAFATERGLSAVRANASCIDGSEGLPLPYRRRLA